MTNTFRKAAALAALGFVIQGFLYAKGKSESIREPLTLYTIKGPSGVGLIRLFEDPPRIGEFDLKAEALAHNDLMAARFISGEARVGILPPNGAAKIASSGRDIRALAVIGEGMLSLLSDNSAVRSLADLKGRTVEAAGQGATPDYVLRRILKANGLVPDTDVKLGYSLAYPEIAQSLIAGRISLALLPEPFATMARAGKPSLVSVADIQAEWLKAAGGANFPMTLLAADGAFADRYPEAITELLGAVKDSIEWVVSHPAEAGTIVEKHGLGLKAAVVTAAVPKSGYVFIPAAEARPQLEALFREFLENAPASIGGALPPDGFYYE